MADRETVILLNERLNRLALVLDEIMPNCANLVRDAMELLKEQESTLNRLRSTMEDMVRGNASEEVSYLLRLIGK